MREKNSRSQRSYRQRKGLTPKFRDGPNLVKEFSYSEAQLEGNDDQVEVKRRVTSDSGDDDSEEDDESEYESEKF